MQSADPKTCDPRHLDLGATTLLRDHQRCVSSSQLSRPHPRRSSVATPLAKSATTRRRGTRATSPCSPDSETARSPSCRALGPRRSCQRHAPSRSRCSCSQLPGVACSAQHERPYLRESKHPRMRGRKMRKHRGRTHGVTTGGACEELSEAVGTTCCTGRWPRNPCAYATRYGRSASPHQASAIVALDA